MARFRAVIKGNRGAASRLGTKSSGIRADVNGWNVGVCVIASVDSRGNDVIRVYRTGGSNGTRDELIATIGETPEPAPEQNTIFGEDEHAA